MKQRIAITFSLIVFAATAADAQHMEITKSGANPSVRGAAENFTGTVMVDALFPATDQMPVSGGQVTFEPGARSAWHTHPAGQTLIVTSGVGWVQEWNGEKREIRQGDVVWTPPGVKHWHGASANNRMTHIALQAAVGGKNVNWMEQVSEEQYKMATTQEKANVGGSKPTRRSALTPDEIRSVSPALAQYTERSIGDDLWKRPDLSARDRSIVTVAALIARQQTMGMLHYFNVALDSGVTPGELSEIITHLAFYSGWSNAFAAVPIVNEIFSERGISPDQLPPASPKLLPLDEAAEAKRAANVGAQFGATAPGVVQYTTDVLFRDLWLRPGLLPRDRSLVTVSALIASGQVAQVPYHLNRAMDNGLTQEQASEVVTQLAFYAGWPNAFSALPVVKEVFEKRPAKGAEK